MIINLMPEEIDYHQIALELIKTDSSYCEQLSLRVNGNSMKPMLQLGDTVIAQPINPEQLRRGDIVVIKRERDFVTHRLVMVDNKGWHTKGDNVKYADPPVTAQSIMGRVTAIKRNGRHIDLTRYYWLVANRLIGWISWLMMLIVQLKHKITKDNL